MRFHGHLRHVQDVERAAAGLFPIDADLGRACIPGRRLVRARHKLLDGLFEARRIVNLQHQLPGGIGQHRAVDR